MKTFSVENFSSLRKKVEKVQPRSFVGWISLFSHQQPGKRYVLLEGHLKVKVKVETTFITFKRDRLQP